MASIVFVHVLWSTVRFLSQELSSYPFSKALLCVLKLNVRLLRLFRNELCLIDQALWKDSLEEQIDKIRMMQITKHLLFSADLLSIIFVLFWPLSPMLIDLDECHFFLESSVAWFLHWQWCGYTESQALPSSCLLMWTLVWNNRLCGGPQQNSKASTAGLWSAGGRNSCLPRSDLKGDCIRDLDGVMREVC